MRVLLLPRIERRLTDPQLSGNVAERAAGLDLAEGVRDLFLGKFRPLHWSRPFVMDRRSRHPTLVLTAVVFGGDVSVKQAA